MLYSWGGGARTGILFSSLQPRSGKDMSFGIRGIFVCTILILLLNKNMALSQLLHLSLSYPHL